MRGRWFLFKKQFTIIDYHWTINDWRVMANCSMVKEIHNQKRSRLTHPEEGKTHITFFNK